MLNLYHYDVLCIIKLLRAILVLYIILWCMCTALFIAGCKRALNKCEFVFVFQVWSKRMQLLCCYLFMHMMELVYMMRSRWLIFDKFWATHRSTSRAQHGIIIFSTSFAPIPIPNALTCSFRPFKRFWLDFSKNSQGTS